MIREVNVSQLTDVVERLCIEANEHLPSDVKCAIEHCRACEDGEIAQGVLDNIIENYKIADAEMVLSGKVYQLGYSVNYYGCTYCTDDRNHGSDGIPDLQQI